MSSQILLRTLARTQGQRHGRALSQQCRFRLLSVQQNGFGNKHGVPMIKLQSLQGHIAGPLCIGQSRYYSSIPSQQPLSDEASPTKTEDLQPNVTLFSQLDAINPELKRSIQKVSKRDEMSEVQSAVLSRLPNEKDVFVRAKTGTDKTLTFLVAALETALAGKSTEDIDTMAGTSILVVSPTRELAIQIADQARILSKPYRLGVHCLVGGADKHLQIHGLIKDERCDIVVGTPGRLSDMLSSVYRLKRACGNLKVLVLDEMDQLLNMGPEAEQQLQRILQQIPRQRQTMLYSATLSNRQLGRGTCRFALSHQFDIIDTIRKNNTNPLVNVKQSAYIAPYDQQLHLLERLLTEQKGVNPGKVVVFVPANTHVAIYAQLFKYLAPRRISYEVHSQLSQSDRTKVYNRFSKSRDGILVSTDLSAYGVHYPNVSLVIQIGVPDSKERYIQRLGQTNGESVLVLAPFEDRFVTNEIADLPVEIMDPPGLQDGQSAVVLYATHYASKLANEEAMEKLFAGYVKYYTRQKPTIRRSRREIIRAAEEFLEALGIKGVPELSSRFQQQLPVKDTVQGPSTKRRNQGPPTRRQGTTTKSLPRGDGRIAVKKSSPVAEQQKKSRASSNDQETGDNHMATTT